jgi:prophage regulatory protein
MRRIVSENRAAKPRRVMRLPEVKRATGMSKSAIYAKIAVGQFPKPAHLLSDKISVWDADEIFAIVEAAFNKRDEAAAG